MVIQDPFKALRCLKEKKIPDLNSVSLLILPTFSWVFFCLVVFQGFFCFCCSVVVGFFLNSNVKRKLYAQLDFW